MEDQLLQLIEESIKLELNMADLYRIFSDAFSEDSDFWQELQAEEKRHAVLIKAGRDILYEFPRELLSSTLEDLFRTNDEVVSLCKEYNANPPSRESAFKVALSLEQSAGEVHFQNAMEKISASRTMEVFKELSK